MIYDLVNSLDQREAKRIVDQLACSASFLQLELFNALRMMRSIDDEKLKKSLRSEKMIRYLSKYKTKLKHTILSDLSANSADADHRSTTGLIAELGRLDALRFKGLEEDALKHLEKLYDSFDDQTPYWSRILVLNQMDRVIRSTSNDQRTARVSSNDEELARVYRVMENQHSLKRLKEAVFAKYLEVRSSSDELKEFGEIMNDPLLAALDRAISFDAKRSFIMAHACWAQIINNREELIKWNEQMVHLWEVNPANITRRPFTYQRMLVNLLNVYYDIDHRSEFDATYQKALAVELSTKKEKAASTISLLGSKLLYLLNTRQLAAALAMRSEIDNGLEENFELASFGTAVNFLFNVACMYFVNDDLRETKIWLNRILDLKGEIRHDLRGMSMILLLLCDFNRDHSGLVLPSMRSVKRYYESHQDVSAIEQLVFNCVRDMLNRPKAEESRYLLETITGIKDLDVKKNEILGGEPVLFWLTARLQGSSIRAVYESSV